MLNSGADSFCGIRARVINEYNYGGSMSKFVRIVGIGAAAAAAMCLLDPDRGRTRRAKLSGPGRRNGPEAEEEARAQAEHQKGVVQGLAHDLTEPFRPDPTSTTRRSARR